MPVIKVFDEQLLPALDEIRGTKLARFDEPLIIHIKKSWDGFDPDTRWEGIDCPKYFSVSPWGDLIIFGDVRRVPVDIFYSTGGNAYLFGNLDRNYFGAAKNIYIEGNVDDARLTAKGNIVITGDVLGSPSIAAGGNIIINGTVPSARVAAKGSVYIGGKLGQKRADMANRTRIERACVAAGKEILLKHSVETLSVLQAGEAIFVDGTIGEDARVEIGGRVVFGHSIFNYGCLVFAGWKPNPPACRKACKKIFLGRKKNNLFVSP